MKPKKTDKKKNAKSTPNSSKGDRSKKAATAKKTATKSPAATKSDIGEPLSISPKSTFPNDRRRAPRRPILDSFSFFIALPKKGPHRLPALDVSELGLGFMIDVEGENAANFPVQLGDVIDVQFYLNQTLYIPVKIRIARIVQANPGNQDLRRVGAEFLDRNSPPQKAFTNFIRMIDEIAEVAKVA